MMKKGVLVLTHTCVVMHEVKMFAGISSKYAEQPLCY